MNSANQGQLEADNALQGHHKSARKSRNNLASVTGKGNEGDIIPDGTVEAQSFLALCVNTRGIYKVCSEISVPKMASDAQVFLDMKTRYLATRGYRSRLNFLMKPTTIEFIKVNALHPNPSVHAKG
jgi:hypothetical protein